MIQYLPSLAGVALAQLCLHQTTDPHIPRYRAARPPEGRKEHLGCSALGWRHRNLPLGAILRRIVSQSSRTLYWHRPDLWPDHLYRRSR